MFRGRSSHSEKLSRRQNTLHRTWAGEHKPTSGQSRCGQNKSRILNSCCTTRLEGKEAYPNVTVGDFHGSPGGWVAGPECRRPVRSRNFQSPSGGVPWACDVEFQPAHVERKRHHLRYSGNGEVELRRLLRSEEHTSELQSPCNLVCRLL